MYSSSNGVVSAGIFAWATEQFNAIQMLLDIGIPTVIAAVGVFLWWRSKWTFGGLVRSVILCGIALWALAGTGLIWARDTTGETIDTAGVAGLVYAVTALIPLRPLTQLVEPAVKRSPQLVLVSHRPEDLVDVEPGDVSDHQPDPLLS